jgi:hypothetical protein
MLTDRRPALVRQSWKISLGNYFLAALVGCSVGSVGMSVLELVRGASASALTNVVFGLAFGTAVYLIFSLPFALLGLAPIAFIGELLARKTVLHPMAITAVVALASAPVAVWMMPGVRFTSPNLVAISFGIIVTLSWALLSFRTDGLASAFQLADRG